MDQKKKTLYLIDGTALAYRAFFAFIKNPLINSKGENTSATFGFVNSLLSMIRSHTPDYIGIVFDTGKPTFRHEIYSSYKATRQKMPDQMIDQVPRIKQAVEALGLYQMEMNGFEADDVIGTLALKAADEGLDVYMVTSDKDFVQLIRENVSMYNPMKDTYVRADNAEECFGVKPERMIDLLALMGDSSDNVPGIPRVGEKTARELISEYGSLDNILDNWEQIRKPALKEAVRDNRDIALLSRDLVTIRTDIPAILELEKMEFKDFDPQRSREFFMEMEFNKLVEAVKLPEQEPLTPVKIVTPENMEEFFTELSSKNELSVDVETTGLDVMSAGIVGISLGDGVSVWYAPLGHSTGDNLNPEVFLPRLKTILENPVLCKVGHNAKFDAIILKRYGIHITPCQFDTLIAAYVLDPGTRSHSLSNLSEIQLDHRMQSITELIGKGRNQVSFAEVDIDAAARYSGDDAETTLRLKQKFEPRLKQEGLYQLFSEIEMPLLDVLMEMEMKGILLDVDFLSSMSEELETSIRETEIAVWESAGEEFNINSPKQLGEILFRKIGLKACRKTKTGFSTDNDTLTQLSRHHDLCGLVLEYRQLAKLKSTYVDALPIMVNPATGRVHTSFNQAVTATGRLSSSEPNLQNIPIRGKLGKKIRKAFIAPPGYVLLSADYSQIELRIMAHISGDRVLKEAFVNREDVHRKTASILFGVFPEIVDEEQRRQAKTINFGVMYGMGAFALSEQLGISREEARRYIENYFNTHAGVKEFMDTTVENAMRNGFVSTLLGRKRYVTDITSKNRNIAEFAKRTAINTPIQGSAADLIKRSMINLRNRLHEESLDSHILLQVHDELVLETAEGSLDRTISIVKETMESAMQLDVPLVVETGWGKNWLEAH